MSREEEISKIAYDLYLQRHGEPGDPVEDWVRAEKIFQERNTRTSPEKSAGKVSIRIKASPRTPAATKKTKEPAGLNSRKRNS